MNKRNKSSNNRKNRTSKIQQAVRSIQSQSSNLSPPSLKNFMKRLRTQTHHNTLIVQKHPSILSHLFQKKEDKLQKKNLGKQLNQRKKTNLLRQQSPVLSKKKGLRQNLRNKNKPKSHNKPNLRNNPKKRGSHGHKV